MPEVKWTKFALDDLERLFDFLKGKDPRAAQKAARKIKNAADNLRAYPLMGKPMEDDTGRLELSASFGKNGYVLRYMLDDDGSVIIIRVWHFLEDRMSS